MSYVDTGYIEAGYIKDGANLSGILLTPEWDIKDEGKKIELQHRTKAGEMYRYKYGAYPRVVLNVNNLSSSDMCQINSLWGGVAPVIYYNDVGVVVVSGFIANASAPIDRLSKPYHDLFMGTIEIEGY